MALQLVDTLTVDCPDGQKKVELHFGDITAVQEKVDMIMVSAFHGDYLCTPGSVIGALKRNLNLDVGALAHDKAEDLRKYFYCWWSKPLADHLPYRRLLCFESSRSGRLPQETISAVFRALVPAASLFDGNGSVISPLLASGDQNHNPTSMLIAMVNGAVHWMRNGLNISTLKICVYRQDATLAQTFAALKSRWEKEIKEEERQKQPAKADASVTEQEKSQEAVALPTKAPSYHFYFSYSPSDASAVDEIRHKFEVHTKGQVRIYSEKQELASSQEFQAEIRSAMIVCRMIITFLSPSFMENVTCLEQYNLALCMSRSSAGGHSDNPVQMAPFYLDTIPDLPTYMTLIQWVDLRIKGGSSVKKEANMSAFLTTYVDIIREPLQSQFKAIKDGKALSTKNPPAKKNGVPAHSTGSYDVFISYSHKNSTQAQVLLTALRKHCPDIRVFIDKDELTTGVLWQHKLYAAISSSRVIVTLVSQDYVASAMCREEHALSVALYYEKGSQVQLVQVLLEEYPDLPEDYKSVHPDLQPTTNFPQTAQEISSAVALLVKGGDNPYSDILLDPIKKITWSTEEVLQAYRLFNYERILVTDIEPARSTGSGDEHTPDVLICYAPVQKYLATHLTSILRERYSLTVACDEPGTDPRYGLIDKASLLVFIVSRDLGSSSVLMDELHIALKRHRTSKTKALYPICAEKLEPWAAHQDHSTNHETVFLSLLPYEACTGDALWDRLVHGRMHPPPRTGDKYALTEHQNSYGFSVYDDSVSQATSFAADRIATLIDAPQDTPTVVLENVLRRRADVLGERSMMPEQQQQMNTLTQQALLKDLQQKHSPTKAAAKSKSINEQVKVTTENNQLGVKAARAKAMEEELQAILDEEDSRKSTQTSSTSCSIL